MSIFLDELTPLRMYRGTYFYPIDERDRMNNSIIYLLTPNTQSSVDIMNNEYAKVNRMMFRSYFIEKNVQFIINNNFREGAYIVNGEKHKLDFSLNEALDILSDNKESVSLNEEFLSINNEENKCRIFFPDSIDDILNEETVKTQYGVYNFDSIFRNMLYEQRMKSQQDCLRFYDTIKEKVPYLQYTYADYRLYRNRNLYYDWSYYTESFFKNLPRGFSGDRSIDLFFNFTSRFLNDRRFDTYKKKTLIIPVNDWSKGQDNPLDYMRTINPLSMLWRTMKNRLPMIQEAWAGYTILFLSNEGYFTLNMDNFDFSRDYAKFVSVLRKAISNDFSDSDNTDRDSKRSIMIQLSDKLERDGGIKLTNLSGGTNTLSKDELKDMGLLDDPSVSNDPEVKKAALVNKLDKIAAKSTDLKDAEKQLDNPEDNNEADWLKDLLMDLQADDGGVKMDAARISRMNATRKEIMTKEVAGKTVGELLKDFKKNNDLPESSIPIESIDEQWKKVKFPNFNKAYDMDPDIVAMFTHFIHVSHPMNVVSLGKENTSTSEDYKDTWTCKYEDAETGKRHTMRLDIPRLIGDRFMKLRGNEKVLIGQLMLLPITKTDDDTVQMVSNYNKIFVRRKSPSGLTKSTPIINKLCKALDKYQGKEIDIHTGDNSKVCIKYELPMEFVDISSIYSKIAFKDKSYISFNMDELATIPFDKEAFPSNSPERKLSDAELAKKYLAVYVKDGKKEPIIDLPFDDYILNVIMIHDDKESTFANLYQASSVAKRLMYSEASIMNTTIPVVVVLSYNIGLQKLLNKLNVKYQFSESRPNKGKTYIKFIDGYLAYSETTSSQNMLLNGLMECDFSDYSIKEINGKDMWLSILDDFGGRIKADGLDNFYDLMFDPITKEICDILKIPNNYIDGLIYANNLLIDNKYNKHTDITGNRLRTNEVIVGHLYLVLSKAFGAYRNMIKRNKGSASFSAKQAAVIDSILNHDQTSSDLSTLTPLLEAEAASKVTFKGLSGMNSERAFSIDKRTYDKSMLGILGLSTGFASTVGINRQTTIDAGVVNKRGFINTRKPSELNNTNTFTVMEALSPMAVNHDDPIRTCMAFTQTVQHQMVVKRGMPNLVTTGCDEALPYLTSDKFAYKFHGRKGTIVEVTDDYIIVKDDDTNTHDYIDTRELIQKNSDGGFYVTTKLSSIVKKGQKVKEGQILAYDKNCYSNAIGAKGQADSISYNIGTLAKVAIMDTDLGYEDSCVVDSTISEALGSEFEIPKDINLPRNSNVYNVVKVGDYVQEGDPLLIFQDAFDEKEANELLRSLSQDNEMLSDLGRKQIHAKVTGVIQDIKIYRTCDIDQLSPTLQKLCKDYDARVNKLKNIMGKYKIDKQYTLESTGKLPSEGKLKGLDGVKIEFYMKVHDKFGIGDKLVFAQALKGVNSYIIPKGEEAYTDFRPNEFINAFLTIDGVMARMVSSAQSLGLMNKILIELARQSQEDLGVKWRTMQEILQNP